LREGWVSYTGLGLIGISARAVEMLSPALREDLRKWVATGGTLFVYREIAPGSDPVALLLNETPAPKARPDLTPHYFGRVRWFKNDPFQGEKAYWTWLLGEAIGHPGTAFNARFGFQGRGGPFMSVPGVGAVPVRAYGLMVALFALAIGPVNYFVLRRKKKLHLLFVTTPALALAMTAAMVAYGILSEGLGVKATMASLTWLDQDRHEAVTLGRMAFYAGMGIRGGLWFPRDIAAFPAAGDMTSGSLDTTEGLRFRGGWVRPRAMLNYVTAGVAPARGRLQVKRAGAALQVTNGQGVGIRQIYLMDARKTLYKAAGIADGAAGTTFTPPPDKPDTAFGLDRTTGIHLLRRADLEPGTFLAELEGSAYFVSGLRRFTEYGGRHLLFGRFSEEGDGHSD